MFKKITIQEVKNGTTVFIKKNWLKTPYLYNRVKVKSSCDIDSLQEFKDNLYVKFDRTTVKEVVKSLSFLKLVLEDLSESNLINNKSLSSAVNNLVSAVLNNPGIDAHIRDELQHHSLLFQQSVRLLTLAAAFGKQIGLTQINLKILAKTAFVMDIGLLKMPHILNSEKPLTSAQRFQLYTHCDVAAEQLRKSDVEQCVIEGTLAHHENLDGSGYPRGLRNKQIPLHARILRILNIYEAITGKRPNQSKSDQQHAIDEISLMAREGKLDQRMVEKFCTFLRIYPPCTYVVNHLKQVHKVREPLSRDTISTVNLSTKMVDRLFVYEIKSIHFQKPLSLQT